MNTTATEEVILKTDVLGRVKTPKERRETLLDEFERSGLSGQRFAEVVGIKYQTFATWAQRRRRARGSYPAAKAAGPTKPVRWLEAVVAATPEKRPTATGVVVQLPGGTRLEVGDEKQAALAAVLLRALGQSC